MPNQQVDRGKRGKQSGNPAEATTQKHSKQVQQKNTSHKCKQACKTKGKNIQKKTHHTSIAFSFVVLQAQAGARARNTTREPFLSPRPATKSTGCFPAKQERAHPRGL